MKEAEGKLGTEKQNCEEGKWTSGVKETIIEMDVSWRGRGQSAILSLLETEVLRYLVRE